MQPVCGPTWTGLVRSRSSWPKSGKQKDRLRSGCLQIGVKDQTRPDFKTLFIVIISIPATFTCEKASNRPAASTGVVSGTSTSILSRTEQLRSYSGLHSHTTPVHIPTLLRSTLLCYSSPPLDWTGLHWTCLSTGLAPDLTWEVAVIHLSLMYLFSRHLYLLVPSLFPACHGLTGSPSALCWGS